MVMAPEAIGIPNAKEYSVTAKAEFRDRDSDNDADIVAKHKKSDQNACNKEQVFIESV